MGYYLLERPNPNGRHYYPTRKVCRHGIAGPHLIVLHSAENLPDWTPPDTGGESVSRYATTTSRTVSWHVTVDSDSVVYMLPYDHTAFHVRGFNSCSIGIELAGQHDQWVNAPVEWLHGLYDNLADVLTLIRNDAGIPLIDRRDDPSKWGVITHAVLDPTRRKDPGVSFPFEWVLDMARGGFRYRHVDDAPSPPEETPSVPERPVGAVSLLGGDVSPLQLQDWARSKNASDLFVSLAAPARSISLEYGVNPAVVYGIMGHETAFGRFGGVLDDTFHNWGGIKTADGGGNYDPNAHTRFTDHLTGVRAVVQHVAGYAGIKLPTDTIVDPRYHLLAGKRIASIPSDEWTWASSGHDDKVALYANEMSG